MVDEEEKQKISDSLIIYTIGEQKLNLRRFKIKKVKQLAEDLFILHADLQKYLKEKDSADTAELIDPMFLDGVRNTIAKTMNFLFGLEGDKEFPPDWWEENTSYGLLEDIVKEASAMSRMEWLPPFFGAFAHTANSMIPFLAARKAPSGTPTI